MTSLEPFSASSRALGYTRRTARALSAIETRTAVDAARIQSAADIDNEKTSSAVAVTQHALAGAQHLINVEMTLAELTPAAMARLKAIGDAGTLALTGIVMDHATKLRRI